MMTDMEMDLIMAKAEVLSLQKTVREQADMISNLRSHIAALQDIIERQRKLNHKMTEALVGDLNG